MNGAPPSSKAPQRSSQHGHCLGRGRLPHSSSPPASSPAAIATYAKGGWSERRAVDAALAAERALGREQPEMPHNNTGYDIHSTTPEGGLGVHRSQGPDRGRGLHHHLNEVLLGKNVPCRTPPVMVEVPAPTDLNTTNSASSRRALRSINLGDPPPPTCDSTGARPGNGTCAVLTTICPTEPSQEDDCVTDTPEAQTIDQVGIPPQDHQRRSRRRRIHPPTATLHAPALGGPARLGCGPAVAIRATCRRASVMRARTDSPHRRRGTRRAEAPSHHLMEQPALGGRTPPTRGSSSPKPIKRDPESTGAHRHSMPTHSPAAAPSRQQAQRLPRAVSPRLRPELPSWY